MTLASVCIIDSIKVYGILQTRHACNEEFLRIRAPERDTEVLVKGRIEVSPRDCHVASLLAMTWNIHDSYTYLRIGLTTLGISCLAERPTDSKVSNTRTLGLGSRSCRIRKRGVDREHRDLAVVETIESDLPAVRRPPEGLIT